MRRHYRRWRIGPQGYQFAIILVATAGLAIIGATGESANTDRSRRPTIEGGTITGRASAIDGDTIRIRGQRIRLYGIDAPESDQTCEAGGKRYRCGREAARALADLLGARRVDCTTLSFDAYARAVARCHAGGEDVAAAMISAGWAVAGSRPSAEYARLERQARAARRGLWAGTFEPPEQWRRRSQAERSRADTVH